MPLEKDLLKEENLPKVVKASKSQKEASSSGIYAVPVSKKLPWMALNNIPAEFVQDLKDKKKPQ